MKQPITNPNIPFETVETSRVPRNKFNLSHSRLLSCDMGQLIPILCEEAVPGDRWQMSNEAIIRMQPLVAPILHEVNVFTHYYFVPNRILWDGWESFISGGKDGDDSSVLPRLDPTQSSYINEAKSLWDYYGLPPTINPLGAEPLAFPFQAYYSIWNEYYRQKDLQDPIDITDFYTSPFGKIVYRNWEKDYFTSATLEQQRGTSPALPLSGTANAVFDSNIASFIKLIGDGANNLFRSSGGSANAMDIRGASDDAATNRSLYADIAKTDLDDNLVDLSNATTVDMNAFRSAVKVQEWLERNNRGGYEYKDFLKSHFNVDIEDYRLQKPEYIGGSKSPIIVSEVLQTSKTDTSPQGNMAGHGLSVSTQFVGSYDVKEYGWIIGIMSIMPKPAYQQGINRQFLRTSRYDYYFPEFANLSEQGILQAEIYATDVLADNTKIFGFQGRYDEMRYKPNLVCGEMRDTPLYAWHLGRKFATDPELNETFVECKPSKRIFANTSADGFIVMYGNRLEVIRPLPPTNNPSLT